MDKKEIPAWSEEIESVVDEPLRFKAKLDIGEDAYQSLRMKKYLLDAVDAGNGAIAGIAAAKSSVVASTFFAPSGILGAIGIGTAATPIGWAIAAGIVGAGMSVAIGKHFVRGNSSKVTTIPDFINTPLDILAIGLFDLIGMLSMKLAAVDGQIDNEERTVIENYFVDTWGYDRLFVKHGLAEIELLLEEHTIHSVAEKLALFKKENPDCNYQSMTKEIYSFLTEVAQADGKLDEREEMALERVAQIFREVGAFSISKTAQAGYQVVADSGKKGVDVITGSVKEAGQTISGLGTKIKDKFSKS